MPTDINPLYISPAFERLIFSDRDFMGIIVEVPPDAETGQSDPDAPVLPVCGDAYCTAIAHQRTESSFDYDGYDWQGFDREGFSRQGFNFHGYDCYGYDCYGYNHNGYDRDGYDRDGYNRDGYNRDGVDRNGNDRYGSSLRGYYYKPEPQFHGESGPWFGMEIEITTDLVSDAVRIAKRHAGKLVYCKEDSSVDGLEMVTHPMSYDYAMTEFPWDMLTALKDEAQCSVIPQENGIHVHVSRDSFADAPHLYRWLKLWYRNPMDIQRIARRQASHWAAFNPDHRKGQKEHVKRGKPGYNQESDTTVYLDDARYSAINTTNQDTLEIRVFASSLRPRRVKAALQLAAASVEYTRQLTSHDCANGGWDWRRFMKWVAASGKYPDLVIEDRNRRLSRSNLG